MSTLIASLLGACTAGPGEPRELSYDTTAVVNERQMVTTTIAGEPALESLLGDRLSLEQQSAEGYWVHVARSLTMARSAVHVPQLAAATSTSGATAATGVRPMLDSSTWGTVWVRTSTGSYARDSSAVGPANGVLVYLYRRLGMSSYSSEVVGVLEAHDSSTSSMQIGSFTLRDNANRSIGTVRITVQPPDQLPGQVNSSVYAITGVLGAAGQQFTFGDTVFGRWGADVVSFRSVGHRAFAAGGLSLDVAAAEVYGGASDVPMTSTVTGAGRTMQSNGVFYGGLLYAPLDIKVTIDGQEVAGAKKSVFLTPSGAPAPPELVRLIYALSTMRESLPSGWTALGSFYNIVPTLSPL